MISLEGKEKNLSDTSIFVRAAHAYTYSGRPEEEMRVGYAFAFHLFVQGQGDVIIDGLSYPVAKGSLLFIRPGQAHAFRHVPGHPLEAYNIYCDLWSRPDDLEPLSHFAFHTDLVNPSRLTRLEACPALDQLPTSYQVPAHSPLQDWFIQLCQLYGTASVNSEELSASLMKAWLLLWQSRNLTARPSDKRISPILDQMERYPEHSVPYEAWCASCGLAKSQFYTIFRSVTGMTPKAYQLKMKMKKAAARLMESDQSITSIATDLGYDTVHYFSRQFADYYKLSPSRYRNQRRGQGRHAQ